ncbi:MAG: ThiF family adenylyltransferase [Acidibrevibacterium sp.]|jgi:molybdopterin/thiamine biosynthesis adenylyltransferase/nitroreductase|uniref:ThiF family adenylyltransferase n=1 Tax=Acidibrevibacterium fodinaquatile TaxID=1969806 RepID=UPI0023A8F1A7|nr:ThiF family adenylyltransferase [Acidibrevibacterium fodinaquatile]MCA7118608.1 ThiF family adenylyltransferase [Acidibrevibacterium fodinaquatile]
MKFSYSAAFDRNIGWLTEWEQLALRGKRIAIAGMGGVGGVHLLTLARFGIGAFNIADFDRFDIVNFNRQIGANVETVGRPKIDVLSEMALSINPEIKLNRFEFGVTSENIDKFLDGVDVFVDGFDFFEIEIRNLVYARCYELGIPALCAAPIGMGAGCLAFLPGKMSFEQYFGFKNKSNNDRFLRFLVGLAPRGLHRAYLVEPKAIDLPAHKGPSTGAACQICAGITAVNAIKLLLRRGEVQAAPYHHHYDAYRNKLVVSHLPRGLDGPWQRVKIALAQRIYNAARKHATSTQPEAPHTVLEEIINYARWTPSPGNTQPWRFNLTGATNFVVDLCFNATARRETLFAAGMLLESLRIAASAFGLRMEWRKADAELGNQLLVQFHRDASVSLDPLFSHLPTRSVDRRPYDVRPLSVEEKSALTSALGLEFTLTWHEALPARRKISALATRASRQMLGRRERLRANLAKLDWDNPRSSTAIPSATLGLGWLAQKFSRIARAHPSLGAIPGVARFIAWRLETLPILASAACFAIHPIKPGDQSDEVIIKGGMAVQRFWLTAAQLGLAMQPLQRPLRLAWEEKNPTDPVRADFMAAFRLGLGDPQGVAFIGRIGAPRTSLSARATRHSIETLIVTQGAAAFGGKQVKKMTVPDITNDRAAFTTFIEKAN